MGTQHAPEAPPFTNGLAAAQMGLSCFFSDMAASLLSGLRAAAGGEAGGGCRHARAAKPAGGGTGLRAPRADVGLLHRPSAAP